MEKWSTVNNKFEMKWKTAAMAYFKIQSQYLSGKTTAYTEQVGLEVKL
jgi:hypothetical protein